MLAIRMQRTGRKGHAQYRVVVQDSRFSPTSGRIVAYAGSYNPHTKAINLDKAKIETHLSHGAQPSPAVARLLKKEGVKLPAWVSQPSAKKRSIKNPDKLRRNRPAEPAEPKAPTAEGQPAEAVEPAPEAEPTPAEATEPAEPEVTEPAPAEEGAEPAEPTSKEPDDQPQPGRPKS